MKYRVEVVETLSRTIEVEAENIEVAEMMVEEMYNNQEIVLDSNDYINDVTFNASLINDGEKIKVIIVEPNEYPVVKEINNDLKRLQNIVGGYIEVIYPFKDDEVVVIANEEGKMNGMPLNRGIFDDGNLIDIVAGTFIICYAPTESENFESLPENLIKKYCEMFKNPECFFHTNEGIFVIPFETEKEKENQKL